MMNYSKATLAETPIIWYIPGFGSDDSPQSEVRTLVGQIWPKIVQTEVEIKSWESQRGILTIIKDWQKSKQKTGVTAESFFKEIIRMPSSQREKLTIISHSLGGEIAVRLLLKCAEKGISIQQLILLGTAIPNNDLRLLKALAASRLPVISLVNPQDEYLPYFCQFEQIPALGTGGLYEYNPKFQEIVVPKVTSHSSVTYLEYLWECSKTRNFRSSSLVIPQGSLSYLEKKIINAVTSWNQIGLWGNWELRKGILPFKNEPVFSVAFDGFIKSLGTESEMRICFNKIKSQIQNKCVMRSLSGKRTIRGENFFWLIKDSYKGWLLVEDYWTGFARIQRPDGTKYAHGFLEDMEKKFESEVKRVSNFIDIFKNKAQ